MSQSRKKGQEYEGALKIIAYFSVIMFLIAVVMYFLWNPIAAV